MVLALSGRRIDSRETSHPMFPRQNIELVRQRILDLFERIGVDVLVCSAACGADLLALEAAESKEKRRRIVLPFDPNQFRETSVIDRPGNWGPAFDRLVHVAAATGDLVNLNLAETEGSYINTNQAILDESVSIARTLKLPVTAALVWDGPSRDRLDFTNRFSEAALIHGLKIYEIPTL